MLACIHTHLYCIQCACCTLYTVCSCKYMYVYVHLFIEYFYIVLKTLSSAGEFGSLGVSWQSGQSDSQEGLVDGVEYMPMMWGQSKLGESNLLANILNGRGTLHTCTCTCTCT